MMKQNYDKEIIEKDTTILELQSQLKDLMFYLDVQNKLQTNPEAKDGKIVIVNKKT